MFLVKAQVMARMNFGFVYGFKPLPLSLSIDKDAGNEREFYGGVGFRVGCLGPGDWELWCLRHQYLMDPAITVHGPGIRVHSLSYPHLPSVITCSRIQQ